MTLGYNGTITKRNGKRTTNIDVQRINNKLQGSTQYNAALQDQENFAPTVRGQFGFSYQGNYGPLRGSARKHNANATVTHSNGLESQSYSFLRSSTAGQASSESFGFADTRNFSQTLQNSLTANLSRSESTYGQTSRRTPPARSTTNCTGRTAPQTTSNLRENVRAAALRHQQRTGTASAPDALLAIIRLPDCPDAHHRRLNEPLTPETTTRADLALSMGPALYRSIFGDFSASVDVHQFAYGTGDLKASISQQMSLNSPIGSHITNDISYQESNYNGPGSVPFSTLDLQNSQNFKSASDILRIFNGDVYNLSLSFTTAFNGIAQPVQYQFASRPSHRSYLQLQGSFFPGPAKASHRRTCSSPRRSAAAPGCNSWATSTGRTRTASKTRASTTAASSATATRSNSNTIKTRAQST